MEELAFMFAVHSGVVLISIFLPVRSTPTGLLWWVYVLLKRHITEGGTVGWAIVVAPAPAA
eukprot:scaffold142600_cov23-Cyclotella_meneghiniana.AAC.2